MTYKQKNNGFGFKLKKGFSLVEAIIVIAATLVLISMIFGFYRLVFAKADAAIEAEAANSLINSVTNAYQASSNFVGLNNQTLIQDGLLTPEFKNDGTRITTPNGFNLSVQANIDAGKLFSLKYYNFKNKNTCVDFISAISQINHVKAVYVQGQTLMNSRLYQDDTNFTLAITEAFIVEACKMEKDSGKSNLDITVYVEPFNILGDISDLVECVVPSQNPEERDVPCASGYSGTIKEKRTASCPAPYAALEWTEWEEISNTCNIICVTDPLSPETRNKSCATGFLGRIVEQRISVCDNYNGYPVWKNWTVIENTCAPICTAPPTKTEYKACPAGYTGRITETTTYNCPAATGNYNTNGPVVTENTCVLQCKSQLPNPNPEIRHVNKTKACPAGYGGVITYQQQQRNTHTCANPEAAGVPVQSGWIDTSTIINEDSSACVNLCAPVSPLSQWVNRSSQCPSGYTGTITWEQEQSRTSVCNGGTSPVTSGWTDVVNSVRNRVESCAKLCVLPNPSIEKIRADTSEARYEVCPAGQYGPTQGIHYWRDVYMERTRTASCPQTTGNPVWSAYSNPVRIGQGDYRLTANHCNNCPAASTVYDYRWTNKSSSCPSGYNGSITWQAEERASATQSYNCPAGTTSIPSPTTGTWSAYSATGSTRNRVENCVVACTPSTTYEWAVDDTPCPSNQYAFYMGSKSRAKTVNCPNGNITYGDWVIQDPRQCCRNGLQCQLQ